MEFLKDKILRQNFSYLFILQIANYIIPLFLFPYLGRILGAENFGKIMFAQAFVAYFVLLTDFGFNVSSTKNVSDSFNKKDKISRIFWNTLFAKIILLGISCMIFIIIIFSFSKFRSEKILYIISFVSVLSSVFLPLWLFQGLEKMGALVIVNTIPKIVMCFVTVLIVKNSDDYVLALLIQVMATMASSLLSLIIVFKLKLVSFVKPTLKEALKQIHDGWHIFATSLSTNLYTTTNTVILGLIVGNAAVGIYSAGDKIVRAVIGLLSSTTQVVFPRVNAYYLESKLKSFSFSIQMIRVMFVICVVIGFLLYFFAGEIILLVFKNGDFNKAIDVLKCSALLPLFSIVNGLIAVNIFITFGFKSQLLKIVFFGCLFSLVFITPMVYYLEEIGAVLCVVLTEVFIFFLLLKFMNAKVFKNKLSGENNMF